MTESGIPRADQFHFQVSDRAPDDWAQLLARDPRAEYTHTRYWTEAVCGTVPGAVAVWLTVRREGELVAGLNAVRTAGSRRVPGLAYSRCDSSFEGTSGGAVIAEDLGSADQDLVFALLVDGLAAQRDGLLGSCAMVLSPAREERFGPVMRGRRGWLRKDALTALISLAGGIDNVEKNRLVTNKRNERNRGLRRGVVVEITTDESLLEEYYAIYEQATRHWGVPANPLPLLKTLLADPRGRVFFTCARLEGKVIGGHLNLALGPKVLVWNGVTDPAYARKYFPATICFWGDLTEACRRNADWLDLGGSAGVNSLSGFKKYFGAELAMRGLYLNDGPAVGLLKKARDLWRGRRDSGRVERWHDQAPGAGNGGRP